MTERRNIQEFQFDPATVDTPWLHRFSILLACGILLLIAAGGMVTSTGSGLSVPDWPTTYGHNMFAFPYAKWVGGIFYEHGHRLIASTIGFLTIVLAVWIQRVEPRGWLRRLGWIALGVVIAQGALGGLTVLFLLPTWISVFHACLAQTFLCIIVSIAVVTSRAWKQRTSRPTRETSTGFRRASVMLVAAVFLQLFLGAVMRHTDSGLAVPDFPLAYGRVIPGLSNADMESHNQDRAFELALPPVSRGQIVAHMVHRMGAVLVTGMFVIAIALLIRQGQAMRGLRRPLAFIGAALVIQVGLGAFTVWTGRNPWIATAHVATGALILGLCWLNVLIVHGFTGIRTLETRSMEADAVAGGVPA